jgi:hypothetical protein
MEKTYDYKDINIDEITESRIKISAFNIFSLQSVYHYSAEKTDNTYVKWISIGITALFVEAMLFCNPTMYILANGLETRITMSSKGFLYISQNNTYETKYNGSEANIAQYISFVISKYGYTVLVINKNDKQTDI